MFSGKQTWGWLYPYQENLPITALKERSYTVGADGKSAIIITEKHVGSKVSSEQFANLVSHPHLFKIKRKDGEVVLKSTSDCDLFINKTKIAREKGKYTLNHNDFLAVIRPDAKVFVYLDNMTVEAAACPKEIKDKYVQSKELGSGTYGVVTLMFHKENGKKYAMKDIIKKHVHNKYLESEKKILTTVSHPHVIHMEEVSDTPQNLYIILEYMEGGDLSTRIPRSLGLLESIAKFFFYQIALAVEYLHELGVTHRDLKPENILLSSDDMYSVVKVTDFGVSKAEWNTKLRTPLGTPAYEAPEVLQAADTRKPYTNKADVWSLGVILFYCLNGKRPFDSLGDILSGTYWFTPEILKKISKESVDLVKKMLIVDPDHRMNMKQILAHKWLQDDSMRRRVDSLTRDGRPKGAAVTQAVSKREVVHQLRAKLVQVPAAAQLPKPAGKYAVPARPVYLQNNAVQPRLVHAERNVAAGGEGNTPEWKFLNERRLGQPRGWQRFRQEAAADRGRVAVPPPPAEAVDLHRRIDNRRTQPFPGTVKKNLHKFQEKKP